ncbi:adenylosuccinate lyase [Petrotoga sibirica]|uniref:Adenylosuccinate lyase n=2 Tax=Petrotoga sibirica TaxID=156202 RepID=A0A4V3GQK6_9BACT|nr:adenylosuccinate lyase [Petrotoga sibirica DSM 13575]POZ91792.1 adenylosuccinate lyase [Petrotoga sp. SL27]TDX15413.1 adenylosuccinate lyase [Petrotoga sibirica]
MIERYSLSPIKDIWTLDAQYKRWLEVEVAVIEAFEELNLAPKGTSRNIRQKAKLDVQKILDTEKIVDHDVIAFIKVVTEDMGDEARYFHKGLTSSDIVDTALSLAIKRAGEVILDELTKYIANLKKMAVDHKYTIIVGRTHGVHAEPTSFGLKILGFVAEEERNKERLEKAIDNISQGKLSGAVGNYANIEPKVEEIALKKLNLRPCKVSTQVLPRDLHAEFFSALAMIGSSIERLAIEIRHFQKTEVLEVEEPFKKGQRGSSAMPHKKNPILCERLTGMSRMLRSYLSSAYENISLWHERDISHSSVERVFIPDATMLTYYMLNKANYLVHNLVVHKDRMKENIEKSYNLIYSQRVLLKLVELGVSREEAYKIVQENAMKAWNERRDFKAILLEDKRVREKLSGKETLEDIFSPDYYLKNVNEIYERFNLS